MYVVLRRPYYIHRIPHSNLVMIVVKVMYETDDTKLHAGARPLMPPGGRAEASCQKINLVNLVRRRLKGCYTYDPEV
jgi:hypothetical protein